jgi:hypothetical protein
LKLHRVCPVDADATPGAPGHPLFVPRPQGAGRVDNPHLYSVLYAADSPEAAIAERFGNLAVWSELMLAAPPSLPRGSLALVAYDAPRLRVLDLDDAEELLRRGLRPSDVVTRDRSRSQRWAEAIHREDRSDGVRWWSYYREWGSYGLWNTNPLRVASVTPLRIDSPALRAAATAIVRAWA